MLVWLLLSCDTTHVALFWFPFLVVAVSGSPWDVLPCMLGCLCPVSGLFLVACFSRVFFPLQSSASLQGFFVVEK